MFAEHQDFVDNVNLNICKRLITKISASFTSDAVVHLTENHYWLEMTHLNY